MKLSFFLVYTLGGSTPVYGRRNEVVGRTNYHPYFKGQAMRLTDDPTRRNDVVSAVRISSDHITMPVMRVVVEDESGALSEYHPALHIITKVGVGIKTQDKKLDQPTIPTSAPKPKKSATPKKTKARKSPVSKKDIEADIKCLIEANGPLTVEQMADFLAEPKDTIAEYLKSPDKFVRDGDFYIINTEGK
jgi:hypothetical protein